jgi:hypothetical protein
MRSSTCQANSNRPGREDVTHTQGCPPSEDRPLGLSAVPDTILGRRPSAVPALNPSQRQRIVARDPAEPIVCLDEKPICRDIQALSLLIENHGWVLGADCVHTRGAGLTTHKYINV